MFESRCGVCCDICERKEAVHCRIKTQRCLSVGESLRSFGFASR